MIWIEDESNGLKKDEKCRDMWNEYSICIRVVISGKKFELLPYLLLANLKLTSFKCVQTMMIAFTVLDTYTSVCEKEFNEIKLEYNYFASSTTWEISFFVKKLAQMGLYHVWMTWLLLELIVLTKADFSSCTLNQQRGCDGIVSFLKKSYKDKFQKASSWLIIHNQGWFGFCFDLNW